MNRTFSWLKDRPYPIFVVLVLSVWLYVMISQNLFHFLHEHWEIMVTMVFGSFVAGASSEGGGAIAFPVLTLGLNIAPATARNFSFAIQSIGMLAASIYIVQKKIKIEWQAIKYGSIGGAAGIVFSTFLLTQYFSPVNLKIFFVSLWLAFGFVLYKVNKDPKKLKLEKIPANGSYERNLLMMFGALGGMVSGLIGNGIDILIFAVLALHYAVSEKVATPTSILLMTGNTLIGLFLHAFIVGDFNPASDAYEYWLACIPVVVFGAPLGALVVNLLNRHVIYVLLMSIIIVQYIFAFVVFYISKALTWEVVAISIVTVFTGYLLFLLLNKRGSKRIAQTNGK